MNFNDTYKKLILTSLMLIACLLIMAHQASAVVIVSADSIRAHVVSCLESFAGKHDEKIEVEIPALADIQVSCDSISEIRVIEPEEPDFSRRMRVDVAFIDGNGETAKTIFVRARIRHLVVVAVAVEDIRKDTVISEGTIEFREMDVTLHHGYFTAMRELEGKQTSRDIQAGSIITNRYVEVIPLIRQGETVTIESCVGSVVVTAVGTAREDGGRNDSIRVYNATTRRTINCQIVNESTVRIGGQGGYSE